MPEDRNLAPRRRPDPSRTARVRRLGTGLVLAVFLGGVASVPAQGKIGSPRAGRDRLARAGDEGKAFAAAIGKALGWLDQRQGKDGAPRELRTAEPQIDAVASAALILACFVGDGSTLKRGAFQDDVADNVKWLVRQQGEDGRFAVGEDDAARAAEPLLGHALATYALFETALLSADNRYLQNANRALSYAVTGQLADGSWPETAGGKEGDFRTTVWTLHGLIASQHARLPIADKSVDAAIGWLEACADDDGTGPEARIRNAAGAFLLLYAKRATPKDERITEAAKRVAAAAPTWGDDVTLEHLYFATYLLYQVGGADWKDWSGGVLRLVREWLRKPKGKRTIERACAGTLALMSFYRFGPIWR